MHQRKSLSTLPAHLATQIAIKFEYEHLDAETRITVQQHTSEIKNLLHRTTEQIIEIGLKLTDVKDQLGHGKFRSWLKAEFDWSIPTANRFMQVADKFKNLNLRHLDIAASALYLLASPSTSEEARTEAHERASQGENITYTKAKAIIAKYKKAANLKDTLPEKIDDPVANLQSESHKIIDPKQEKDLEQPSSLLELEKDVETKVDLDSFPAFVLSTVSDDEHHTSNIQKNTEQFQKGRLIQCGSINQGVFTPNISAEIIIAMEICLKKLTPEQLAVVITNLANNGLSESHLRAIIVAAQQALNH
jgi:hypothetical protein